MRPEDLLFLLPLRYEDETRITRLADVRDGEVAQIDCTVQTCEVKLGPRRQLLVTVDDGSDTCTLRFFTFYPSHQKALAPGAHVLVRGEVRGGFMGRTILHPQFRAATGELPTALTPVYPTTAQLPFGWKWRYSGVGLVHQSNGQSKPLSRSWNRVYLMTGIELDNRWSLSGRLWKRIPESSGSDDNPGISDYVGRGEMTLRWNADKDNTLSTTVRSTLSNNNRGSVRVEWLRALGTGMFGGKSNLRLHTSLFSGYGDSMIDYNHKRTVFSVGLSLVDF